MKMQPITNPFFVNEHPTTFSNTLHPREMQELKNSNYPFSRVDERAHENKIPLRVRGFHVTIRMRS
jgi:hypothetical protein